MPIRILPDNVVSAIAAGEVIERPESVVKELVENSIDASARRILISIEGGGRKLIEVTDNGMGIPIDEVPLAVERYATSKLETEQDLFHIDTLGFRGEALTSIGAVSRMELITRSEGEELGTRLAVAGGQISAPQPIGAPPGTRVVVRELFFNLPARLKFLKSEATERHRIQALIARYAIAYPHISFRLMQEGREGFYSTGSGDRREVLAACYGLETAKSLIHLPEMEETAIRVSGFISPPSVHRGTRREITFFVQGRWIQDPSLAAAVIQAYHGLLMVGRYPLAVILLQTPPDFIDVNVHPTKAEIRFKDPSLVFRTVQRAVRGVLLGQAPAAQFHFESSWRPANLPPSSAIDPGWAMAEAMQPDLPPVRAQSSLPQANMPLLRAVGQVGAAYLVAEGPDGLYLIDQHAAHERVLFERMMSDFVNGKLESQQLLGPQTVELTHREAEMIEGNLTLIRSLGFEVEPFGKNVFRLRGVPAVLSKIDPEQSLRVLVEDIGEDEAPLASEFEARIIARVCKRAAVKSGQVLSSEEQRKLIRDLEACTSPRSCPHGRPTMIHLSVDALERQFGRRG